MADVKISLGVDDSGLVTGMKRAVTTVGNAVDQLNALTTLTPVINTSKFEESLNTMRNSYVRLLEHVGKEVKYNVKTQRGLETRTFPVELDKLNSQDKILRTSGALKNIIASNSVADKESLAIAKELVTFGEMYAKSWSSATGEVYRHNAAVKEAEKASLRLAKSHRERIDIIGRSSVSSDKINSIEEAKRQIGIRNRIIAEASKMQNNAGDAIIAKNKREIEQIESKKAKLQEQAAIDKRNLGLMEASEKILAAQNSLQGKSLDDLRKKVRYAQRLVEIQKELSRYGLGDSALFSRQSSIASQIDPRLIKYERDVKVANSALKDAEMMENLYGQKNAKSKLMGLANQMYVSTGEKSYKDAADALQIEINKLQELINLKKKAKDEEDRRIRASREQRLREEAERRAQEKQQAIDNRKRQYDSSIQDENIAKTRFRDANGITSDSLTRLRAKRDALEDSIDAIQKRRTSLRYTEGSDEEIKRLGRKIELLNKLKNKYIEQIEAEKNSRRNDNSLDRERSAERLNKLLSRQHGILGRLASQAAMYFSLYGIINFGKRVVETTGYFEQQKVALEGITRSAADANRLLNQIKDFALKSPFETKDLVGFTKQLSAFSVPTDQLFDVTKRLADLSAGLGVDMSRIVLAYGQVRSAAVLRGQELRQFTEAGIPMVEALRKKLSELRGEYVAAGEVFDAISKRQVSFEMVNEVLMNMTKEGGQFYKMQENMVGTLYGQVQKLKDMWTLSMDNIGRSAAGPLNGIVKLAQKIAANFREVVIIVGTTFAGRAIGAAVQGVANLIRMVNRLRASFSLINLSNIAAIALTAIGAVSGFIWSLISDTNEFKEKLDEINKSVNKDSEKQIGALNSLLNKMKDMKQGTQEWDDAVSTLKQNYQEFLTDEIISQLNKENKSALEVADSYNKIAESIRNAIDAKAAFEKAQQRKEVSSGEIDKVISGLAKYDFWGSGLMNRDFLLYGAKKESTYKDANGVMRDVYRKQFSYDYSNTEIANESDLINKYRDVAQQAWDRFELGETHTEEEFVKLFTNVFRYTAPKFSSIYSDELKVVAQRTLSDIQKSDAYKTWAKSAIDVDETMIGKVNNIFNKLDYSKIDKFKDVNGTRVEKSGLELESDKNIIAIGGVKDAISLLRESATKDKSLIVSEINNTDGTKTDRWVDLFNKLNNEINSVSPSSVDTVKKALSEFKNAFEGSSASAFAQWVDQIISSLEKVSNSVSGRASDIKSKFSKYGRQFEDDSATSALYKKYILDLNDLNYEALRNSIPEERDKLAKDMESHRNSNYEGKAEDQRKLDFYDMLMLGDNYDINAKKHNNKSGRNANQVPEEVAEFVNKLKNAYDIYKDSVEKAGLEGGLNYMKTDKKMSERFGGLFGDILDNVFKDDNGNIIKIGGKSAKDVISKSFNLDGVETGVVNFEDAMRAVADQLTAVYRTNTKANKSFLTLAKSIRQTADSIAKDNLNAWISKLNAEIKTLTTSFEVGARQAELYRKIMANGTEGLLGNNTGVSREYALFSDSVVARKNVETLLKYLNDNRGKGVEEYSLGDISTYEGAKNALEKLRATLEYQNGNNSATALGQKGGELEQLLNKYLSAIEKELGDISGKVYSGNTMADLIANSTVDYLGKQGTLMDKNRNPFLGGKSDPEAMKALIESSKENATKIFDEFLRSNDFKALESSLYKNSKGKTGVDFDELWKRFESLVDSSNVPEAMKLILKQKKEDLRMKVDEFNAQKGAPVSTVSSFLKEYRGADAKGQKEWDRLVAKRAKLQTDYNAAKILNTGESPSQEMINLDAQMKAVDERMSEIGENGRLFALRLKEAAAVNLQAKLSAANDSLEKSKACVTDLVSAFKDFSNVLTKFYDVMNDGENPDWMKEMDGFIEDFSENFEALIAPMTAVITMIGTMTTMTLALADAGLVADAAFAPLLVIMLAVVATAAVVAAVVAAFQAHDRKLENEIEKLKKQAEELDNAISNLNSQAERMTGWDKFIQKMKTVGLTYQQMVIAAKEYSKEMAKNNTDEDTAAEFWQKMLEYQQEYLNGIKDMRDELVQASDSWADSMSSAIRGAFQNGENAARAMRDSVKTMMGDIVEEMVKMSVLQPMMEQAVNNLLGGSPEQIMAQYGSDMEGYAKYIKMRLNNDEAMRQFQKDSEEAGNATLDMIGSLSEYMEGLYTYNSQTSSLSGGIESVTEDTARRLEALSNSQLGVQIEIRNALLAMTSRTGTPLISNAEAQIISNAITQSGIGQDVNAIRSAIDDMRNGIRPLKVYM